VTKTSEYLQRHRLLTWKQLCGTHAVNARVNHWKVTIQLVLTIGPVSHCLQGCNCAQRSADWSGRSDRCADCRSALHSAAVRGRATLNSTVGYTSIGLAGQASCMNVHSNLSAVSAVTNGGPQHCSDYDRRCQYNDQFRTLKSNFSVCIE